MKIAIGLDGTIADIKRRVELYEKQLHTTIEDPFKTPKIVSDESFWAGMKEYKDFDLFRFDKRYMSHDIYVFTRRPQSLANVTHAWLDRKGWGIPLDWLVCQAIPRYDSRLLHIDLYIDTDLAVLKTFEYDTTQPVYLDRSMCRPVQTIERFEVPIPPYIKRVTWPEEAYELTRKESPWSNV